jgi:hypothetical protein
MPIGYCALVVTLSGLLAAPAMSQDTRSLMVGFSLASKPENRGNDAFRPARAEPTPAAVGRTTLRLGTVGGRNTFPPYRGTVASLKSEAVKPQKPPVSKIKVWGQVLGGAAVTAAAFGAAILTASVYLRDDDEAMRRRATTWYVVGGAALTPLAVYLIGNIGPQTGSLGKTYLCGLAGVAAGTILLLLAFESDPALGTFAFVASTVGPAIGATIGYNSSRRYDPPSPVRAALLNMGQGKLRLGIPVPEIFFSGWGRSPGLAVRIFRIEL